MMATRARLKLTRAKNITRARAALTRLPNGGGKGAAWPIAGFDMDHSKGSQVPQQFRDHHAIAVA
jgi:hypothetical protein